MTLCVCVCVYLYVCVCVFMFVFVSACVCLYVCVFAMNGDGCKALEFLDQMALDGVNPDAVSYLAALCACNHAGLVEDGVRLFDTMKECGVKPNVKHYGSVVDLLGRAGRIREACDIINSMPMVPLYTIEEHVDHSSHPFCDHCRCVGSFPNFAFLGLV